MLWFHVVGVEIEVPGLLFKGCFLWRRYKCVIVLCDQMWLDPDLDARNGILMQDESDMLRLDSMIMSVQLSIRQLLEVRNPQYGP